MVNLNKNVNNGMVVVTTDAGAGSSGKGSLNAYLALRYNFDLATNNFSSNAGHFVELDDGTRILNQHICSAFVNENILLYINAGANVDLQTLLNEIETIESIGYNIKDRLYIHPHTNIITKEDKLKEAEVIKSGSTFKGCGAALARKVMRVPGQKLAKDYDELSDYIKDMTLEINEKIASGMKVLIEGSQGIDLDINHAEWPYCTSRQTIPAQLIADAGIPPQAITNTILNVRTNPIRINNQSALNKNEYFYTGNYWGAQEITWEEVAKRAGYDSYKDFEKEYGFALMTSVTKKVRRVFEFPVWRMKFVHAISGGLLPDSNVLYSLNFINFVDKNVKGVKTKEELMTPKVKNWLNKNLLPAMGNLDKLKWVRTGPRNSEIVELQ